MTMKLLLRYALLCVVVTFLAMCSNPSEPEENTPLSAEETEGLLNGMMVVFADTMPQITAVHSENEITIACSDGGDARVTIDGSDSAEGDTSRIDFGVGYVPSGCGLKGSDGTDFVLDANPGLDYSLAITIVGFFESFTIGGGLEGGLDWMVDHRSGTCRIDMDLEAELDLTRNPPAANSYLVGDACEHSLRLDVSDAVSIGGTSAMERRQHIPL